MERQPVTPFSSPIIIENKYRVVASRDRRKSGSFARHNRVAHPRPSTFKRIGGKRRRAIFRLLRSGGTCENSSSACRDCCDRDGASPCCERAWVPSPGNDALRGPTQRAPAHGPPAAATLQNPHYRPNPPTPL